MTRSGALHRLRKRLRSLRRDRRGATAVEFMLVMSIMILVFLTIISTALLGVDLLVLDHGSFMTARGQLAADPAAHEAGAWFADMIYMRTGDRMAGPCCGGQGGQVRAKVSAFFSPMDIALFGGQDEIWLVRETELGRNVYPSISGDNITAGQVPPAPLN